MANSVNGVIRAISETNNRYRDPSNSTRERLIALWEMGDKLVRMKVEHPHTIGWAIQRETKGLIKRPTVFRGCKIRAIWKSKDELLRDLGNIKTLSGLKEMIPLIDPAQGVRQRLSETELRELYRHSWNDSPEEFRKYILTIKRRFAHGKLGKPLDRSKHLGGLKEIVRSFADLLQDLLSRMEENESESREAFRREIPKGERRALANMCIALTTKENARLYKRLGPAKPSLADGRVECLYKHFQNILNKESDVERARVRRVISAEALAQLSDIISSLETEESVQDCRDRMKLSIPLG